MTEERKAELASWVVSIFAHVIVIGLLAFMGLFAMLNGDDIRDHQELVDVVWIENGGGSSGESGSTPVFEAASASVDIETPVIIPDRENKKQEEKTNDPPDKSPTSSNEQTPAVRDNAAVSTGNGEAGGQGGSHQGDTVGAGTGGGTGNEGFGSGDGTGNGIGNGGGIGSSPSERAEAVCTYKATPNYPNRMKEQGIGGRVVLEILVTPDDAIENVTVIRSSGYGALDEAAINAAYRCRFSMNGLWGRYTLSYVFEIVDDDW